MNSMDPVNSQTEQSTSGRFNLGGAAKLIRRGLVVKNAVDVYEEGKKAKKCGEDIKGLFEQLEQARRDIREASK
jgi:hypothetical protein